MSHKDLASALLPRAPDRVTVDEAKRYLAEGHFGAGSMAPEVQGT